MLKFEGSQQFRQRLVCSTLSGRPIRIDRIRERDQNPGLRDFEACLLRLLEKVTNGCVVEINETGENLSSPKGSDADPNSVVVDSACTCFEQGKPCMRSALNMKCSTALPTGTSLRYRPGVITGASALVHECGTSRGIGYFLEPLVVISLFGRKVRVPSLYYG